MKKKKKIHFCNIFTIIFILTSIYLIRGILLFDKIEDLLRYFVILIVIIIDIFLLYKLFFKKRKKKKELYQYVYSFILIVFSLTFLYIGSHLNLIYSYFSNFDKKIVVYSVSLVTLKENNNYGDLSKLSKVKIGTSIDGDTQNLSKDIINKYSLDKNNEIITYESNLEMINELYDKKVDYIFLPTNYEDIYGTVEGYEDIKNRIKILDTTEKELAKEEVQLTGSSKDVNEPFTMLLIGIDSTKDGIDISDSFHGDSLILITFNPKSMTATMLSIPRDSYVPITCMNNIDNKITHSSSFGGTKCVKNTVENFLGVTIDYYMKINFTGVVELVEAVGGVEIDVPYSLCEQNSKREFGDKMIYIKKGLQTLNGEQALAYARNRKNNSDFCSKEWTQGERSDFIRAEHQQEVIQAILEKVKGFRSINELENILKVISNNIDTNMDNSKIFSFYNVFKDILISSSSDKVITIQKLFLDGDGQMIYDERSKMVLWNYVLNSNSLTAVKQAMKDNLNGKKQELIKSFSYEIGENYKQKVIGEGYSNTEKYKLVNDLVGTNIKQAETWATNNNLTLDIEYVKNSNKADGTITEQEYPEKKRIDLIPNKTMKVKVVKNNNEENKTSTKVDCLVESTNSLCKLPNLIGKKKSDFETWGNGFSNVISRKYLGDETGTITKIVDANGKEIEIGTTVKTLLDKQITMYITIEKDNNDNDNQDDDNKQNENSNNEDNQNNNNDNDNNNNNNNDNNENQNDNNE